MRIPLALAPLLSALATAYTFDCRHVVLGEYKYDLSPLGGVHEVYHAEQQGDALINTTYAINICGILKGAANRDGLKCGTTKNICAFEYKLPLDNKDAEQPGSPLRALPIAGLDPVGQGSKDTEITRLDDSNNKPDQDGPGLRLKLGGGEVKDDAGKKQGARAIIDLYCDAERTGLEGIETIEDVDADGSAKRDDSNNSSSLQFKSFRQSDDDDAYVLRLDWRTRYACDHSLEERTDNSSHWGFFTWLLVIFFLCTAAYLIFGSWLNYNRYGARGWDLLPHADTIRDVPYIFQDWLRRVVNTLQGPGTRGGYSAV
ncbi:autophagy-related protein 27 [Aspergillus candidus]|uniref:Uncharacterized protein n=1 Tax=Aspergillus candidus TaxID=41067 RepID=A0A2I2F9V5_ASPCN|nr:hypothetical protein BDW47DRAFT_107003 [Aspergillus candidus]PLB37414.1 hypothetical protein BDW47DRAFT_107003 [Aspergillus candidus]